ncbi:hypothetical protein LTR67_006386 [Exophiala xenobiotica]
MAITPLVCIGNAGDRILGSCLLRNWRVAVIDHREPTISRGQQYRQEAESVEGKSLAGSTPLSESQYSLLDPGVQKPLASNGGRLPWQGLKAKRDAKELLVLEKKQATSTSELCDGLPTQFEEYMSYVRNLRYEDQPDYRHLREMFKRLFRRQGFEYDDVFDWTLQEFQRLETETQEPLASNDVGERLGAETTKPSDDGSQDVAKARRRKRR